jgi:hypothetical protein
MIERDKERQRKRSAVKSGNLSVSESHKKHNYDKQISL